MSKPAFSVNQVNSDSEEVRKLRQEFRKLDKDGDGRVDKHEMNQFLQQKGIDDDHRQQIVEELFSKCDTDHSGRIELGEFVDHYVDTKNQLLIREVELKSTILELNQAHLRTQQQLDTARQGQSRNALR